jgi:hypothetical protein
MPARSPARTARPRLEALEGRCLLSTVTNLLDAGPGSLRDAIANTPAGGTVDFQAGLSGAIPLSSGELAISKDLTLSGPGAGVLTVSGSHASRVFDILGPFTVALSGLTIADGFDPFGGGGIANGHGGTLTVTDCILSGNSANSGSGRGAGGGIFNDNGGTLTVTGSILSGNTADDVAGGIYNGLNSNIGSVTIIGSTICGNTASYEAGGIWNDGGLFSRPMTIIGSTISGNTAVDTIYGYGGGIFNWQGPLTITDSTISGNTAGSTMVAGGGIVIDRGSVTITNSTISGNTGPGNGGGIDNQAGGTVTITNSTLSGNSSTDSAYGVGGALFNFGTVVVTNSTIADNFAVRDGGIDAFSGTLAVKNTIVARNTASSFPDVRGDLASQGYNLIGDGSGGSGFADTDRVGTAEDPLDPLLGPLQDNGGPTQTLALLRGSPALNAGDPAQLGTADQRGVVRAGGVNIGAYQASAASFRLDAPHSVTAGMPFDVTVTALDPFGQVALGYAGTVTFRTTDPDPGVVLPADYPFTPGDGGVHTFTDTGLGETTLVAPGDQTLTVTDTADGTITGTATVTVGSTAPGVGQAPVSRSGPGTVPINAPRGSARPGQEVANADQCFASLRPGDFESLWAPKHGRKAETGPWVPEWPGEPDRLAL